MFGPISLLCTICLLCKKGYVPKKIRVQNIILVKQLFRSNILKYLPNFKAMFFKQQLQQLQQQEEQKTNFNNNNNKKNKNNSISAIIGRILTKILNLGSCDQQEQQQNNIIDLVFYVNSSMYHSYPQIQ